MHIFISHATANARLARTLAEAFEHFGATTFLASRAGDIRAGEDWLRGIERALQEADAYIVLLTPESTLRPWVNFEAGAAWFSDKQLLFLRVQALAAGDIPLPISSRQVYALDDVLYHLYVVQAVSRGISDGEAGRTIPHEQVAADLRRKWLLGSAK